ncbi:MAG: heme ABC transporter permease [Gammaproteobacteria bacterium]
MWTFIHRLASPKYFYAFASKQLPWLWLLCLGLFAYGLVAGLIFAPADYQQGEAYRIIYIHVPAAASSLMIFAMMAVWSSLYLIWRIKLADVLAQASAAIGAWYTALALITGALWGKPMWGTWWVWDARLTSELILLFLYIAIIALRNAIPNQEASARAVSLLTLMGVVDLPIIHYSVYWWNTLHQKATLLKWGKPAMVGSMYFPLVAMLLAFILYYYVLMLLKTRKILVLREQQTAWVQKLRDQKALCP